ncbi:MAG: hypothetical protein MJZ22_04490 [Candidatus Saccharibacteria bacterium]|nr:hypothetical protein [Candidatus Saccharibacteria bacterium]
MSENIPQWMSTALQGITAWIDYHRAYYSNGNIPEHSIVEEFCALLNAKLPKDYRIEKEYAYTKLGVAKEKKRADIVIFDKEAKIVKYVFEVKRDSKPCVIKDDLGRLACVKKANPGVCTFSLIITERRRPKEIVSEKGVAQNSKALKSIKALQCFDFSVPKVCKTIHASRFNDNQKNLETANYACAIEIFG